MLEISFTQNQTEAGCDEAGRGCLAGPVVAAAVILPKGYTNGMLNDSKKLSEKKRNLLRLQIEQDALDYAVAFIEAEKIDQINILNASILAMHTALDNLKMRPELILVDGNKFKPYHQTKHHCIIKGDGKYMSIAAASVLAKTYRDEFMEKIHLEFPQYNWKKNKAYPTKEHRKAIALHGITPWHRKSYKLLDDQTKLIF